MHDPAHKAPPPGADPEAPRPKAPAKPLRDPAAYVVTDLREGIYIMTDDAQLAAVLSGADVPLAGRAMKFYPSGSTVTGIPTVSVAEMLASGIIRKADKGGAA